tara:strand:+ start:12203 stop:13408 length:1206 start_codon:yes stop_codon:yes gene_type:complete
MRNFFKIYNNLWTEKSNKLSTLIKKISFITISLGISAVIISSFILTGFKNAISNKVYNFSGHYTVSSYANGLSFKNSPIDLSKGVYNESKTLSEIGSVHPFILSSALIQSKESEIEGVIFKGVSSDYINNIQPHLITFNNNLNLKNSIIISTEIGKITSLNLGDSVTIFFPNDPPIFRKLIISGIYETGLEEIDNTIVIGDINLSRKIYKWNENQVSGLNIYLKDETSIDSLYDKLKNISSFDEFIESTNSKYIQIFDWLKLLDKNVIIFFVIIVFVASFNILSVILILIMDKTQLIGTLKSFGTKSKFIHLLFFRVGFKLSISAVIFANFISILFYLIQKNFKLFKLNKSNYYIDHIPVDINILNTLTINTSMILMIIISIYIPIIFIQKLKILDTIKFD